MSMLKVITLQPCVILMPSCNKLVQDIWTGRLKNTVWSSASHLPGALNVEADQQSRQFNERTE